MNQASKPSPTLTTNTPEKNTNARSCLLRRYDDGLVYPQLQLSVYVAGPPEDTWGFSAWLGRAGCTQATSPNIADMVIFAGGPDVNPSLYNSSKLPATHIDEARDEADLALYGLCTDLGIPMVGICRGAQFLWAMLGGRLYQDVDKHNSGEHEIMYLPTKTKYKASSVHHQMAIPSGPKGFKLLATANVSTKRQTNTHDSIGAGTDFEMWCVPDRAIVGIQGHPEYPGFPNYSELCLKVIDEYVYLSNKTQYRDGKLRLKEIV